MAITTNTAPSHSVAYPYATNQEQLVPHFGFDAPTQQYQGYHYQGTAPSYEGNTYKPAQPQAQTHFPTYGGGNYFDVDMAFSGQAPTVNAGAGDNSMPPMPSAPPPPPPQQSFSANEQSLIDFGETNNEVPQVVSFASPVAPKKTPPASEGAIVPFEDTQNDEALARIISSQLEIMDRVKNQSQSRAIVPSTSNGGDNYGYRQQQQQLVAHNPSKAQGIVHPNRKQMKKERKVKTAGGAVGGAVLGGLILGPVGVVLGGAAGGVASRKIAKSGEKRAQSKFEQRNFQKTAQQSGAVRGAAFA